MELLGIRVSFTAHLLPCAQHLTQKRLFCPYLMHMNPTDDPRLWFLAWFWSQFQNHLSVPYICFKAPSKHIQTLPHVNTQLHYTVHYRI